MLIGGQVMSRSEYTDEIDSTWQHIQWRGAVKAAIKGRRGQKLLRDLVTALDAMPVKELITEKLVTPEGAVCALGAVGVKRRMRLAHLDPDDHVAVGKAFHVANALVREIVHMNDETFARATPAARWAAMREWAVARLTPPDAGQALARIKDIIEAVDQRAMAGEATLQVMTQDELSRIYALACGKPEDWRPE